MSPKDITVPRLRHPEKAHKADNAQPKKPDWIRVKAPVSQGYKDTRNINFHKIHEFSRVHSLRCVAC